MTIDAKLRHRNSAISYAVFFGLSVTALTFMLILTIQTIHDGGQDRLPVLAFFTGIFFVLAVIFWFWMIGGLRKLNADNEHKEN